MTIYTSPIPSVPLPSPTSIFTFLLSSSQSHSFPGTSPAFIDAETNTSISRAQLKSLALKLACGLRTQFKLKRGDTIMVFSPNSISWPVALFGVVAAGLRATLANSSYTSTELAHQWNDSGSKLVFVAPSLLPVVRDMFRYLGLTGLKERVVVMGTEWLTGVSGAEEGRDGLMHMQELLWLGSLNEEEKFEGAGEGGADETVYICYSSGTTGRSKGVETTHTNMTTVLSIVLPVFPKLHPGQDVILGILPFYHIFGAVKLIHLPLLTGIPVVIQSAFSPDAFCSNVQRYKITACLVVPPVILALARHPAVSKYNVSSLRVLLCGAAPLGRALVNEARERLLAARKDTQNGIDIVQGYGLTETSPTTHLLPTKDALRKNGSVGILLPNLEARIVRGEDGLEYDVDGKEEAGELWIRGKSIMKGYLNNPSATKSAITPDGWFKTGDFGVCDEEGFYYIVDRKKELIKYKGFQVPPAELESVLLTHPDIDDVAVIGLESVQQATELPRAYVVHCRPGAVKTKQDRETFEKSVQVWIQTKVARHKFLRGGVAVVDAIPKSAAGKILKRELRQRAEDELQEVNAKL